LSDDPITVQLGILIGIFSTPIFYTVKRVDGKLPQPDQMTQYSSIRGMEHFFDMQIELIRRFQTMKTKYFDEQGYSAEFFYRFPLSRYGVFRQFFVNFPTDESKSKVASPGLDPATSSDTTHYSTTAPY
jgi:hypothetical protein